MPHFQTILSEKTSVTLTDDDVVDHTVEDGFYAVEVSTGDSTALRYLPIANTIVRFPDTNTASGGAGRDWSELTVDELKAECSDRDLLQSGTKQDLIERLERFEA